MTKRNLLITTAVLTLTLAFAGFAAAYGGGGCAGKGGNGPGFSQMFDQLTPEKQEAVKAIFEKHHDKMVDISNDLWAKNTELDALVESGAATKKDIQSLVGDIADLRSDLQEVRDTMHAEIETETGLDFPRRGMGGCARGNGSGDCPRGGTKGNCPRSN